ncbi:hypothetical protein P280DRAFT_303660 [Massarina eburnea CBS 473.64]|uniref:Mid2 domain-containing protein n=1 Tax=Massarina eburnea CBS 473.64 TaxID=1395130 RepID=A0A6A6S3Y4_9PLEO|nr:hypothetical protein P280DRAFT_303660 [Massarina eburnea CBS 473.64]
MHTLKHRPYHFLTNTRSWPGTPSICNDDGNACSYPDLLAPPSEPRNITGNDTPRKSLKSSSRTPKSKCACFLSSPRKSSPCRLPTLMRLITLIFYIALALLFVTTSAIPLSIPQAHVHLHHRQAIPDQSSNTGNEPATVKSDVAPTQMAQPPPPPLPPPQPTSTFASSTSTTTSSLTFSSTSSQPVSGTTPPVAKPQRTKSHLPFSAGVLAGIVIGGVGLGVFILLIAIFCYKRSRRPGVSEIPMRRAKLGSRLGRRSSPTSSQRSLTPLAGVNHDWMETRPGGWLDKGTISQPKAAFHDKNGLVGVPQPAFVMDEKEKETVAQGEGRRVGKVTKDDISAPRPNRPVSAEPLGRLSGMGMGMGYLK